MTLLYQLMAAERQRELMRVAAEVRRDAAPRPERRWVGRRRPAPDRRSPAPVGRPRTSRS